MTKAVSTIRFKAKLSRPATPKGASWSFLVLPASASAKLPTRGMTAVEGTINDHPFRAMLSPDGKRSHWLKVNGRMAKGAGASAGDVVALEIRPAASAPEPSVPADLRKALAAVPEARAVWSDITPAARQDWLAWITSAKRLETRERRIRSACDMLGSGKRRVCCFDRSGVYGGGVSAPEAAD